MNEWINEWILYILWQISWLSLLRLALNSDKHGGLQHAVARLMHATLLVDTRWISHTVSRGNQINLLSLLARRRNYHLVFYCCSIRNLYINYKILFPFDQRLLYRHNIMSRLHNYWFIVVNVNIIIIIADRKRRHTAWTFF